ncbi:annexin B11-like isoform X2 [Chironomus tepperi]|uniref:annexin B11-like isoform X2 n=1 Tax=Chironomus tepperi TaxID=113505 RepID=UPI00391FB8CA
MFPFGTGHSSISSSRSSLGTIPMTVQSNPGYPFKEIPVPFGAGHFNKIGFTLSSNLPSYHSTSSIASQSQSNGISLLQNQLNMQNTQQPSNIYPHINPNAPFSYTQPVYYRRSISDYMKRGTPTVLPKEDFDARSDSEALRKAMKGFGCDDNGLIEVICRRSNQQRQEIAKDFKTHYGKDLIENIKDETRGNFESLLVALMTPTLDFYCKEIYDACYGVGTDEEVLIEVLCTLSNNEIMMIKDRYQELFKKDLEDVLIGETSGNFKRLLVSLLNANRDESGIVDPEKAKADATQLLRAGELRVGTDESVFNSILCQRNYEQLRLIFKEYEVMTGHSFEKALKNEFSGDVKDGFVAIFRCVTNKAEFFAHQLHKSMKGLGTNDRQLIRLVVTRCEIDMVEIKEAFERLFGESLKSMIKGDTSGSYKYGLYALIGEQRSS